MFWGRKAPLNNLQVTILRDPGEEPVRANTANHSGVDDEGPGQIVGRTSLAASSSSGAAGSTTPGRTWWQWSSCGQSQESTLNSSTANSTSILVSLPHSCWGRSNSASRRPSTTSARNAFRRRTPHRIIFIAMSDELEVTDKPHKNDHLRIWVVTTQHVSGQDTGFSSARDGKTLELRQVRSRKSERQLGQRSVADSSNMQRITEAQERNTTPVNTC